MTNLRELERAATSAPWFATIWEDFGNAEEMAEYRLKDTWTIGSCADGLNWHNDGNASGYGMKPEDAALAVASRNAIPDLLAFVDAWDRHMEYMADERIPFSVEKEREIIEARAKLKEHGV